MNTPENTSHAPPSVDSSPNSPPATTEAPRKADSRIRKTQARRGHLFKMVPSPEIRQRYEAACQRLEAAGEALNREAWEMVKTELESLYEFQTAKEA